MCRISALLACGLLAACASAPQGPLAPRDQIGDFALEARFALRVSLPDRPEESSGGRLEWEHRNGNDRILISSPLGVGVAEIDVDPTRGRLRTADGQLRESADPDALMEEVTGRRLPVRQLPSWLLGRAGATAHVTSDSAGRPARLYEAGWQIDYSYPDDTPGALPTLVSLRRDSEIDLRLRIEEWRTAP
jgi:outer membrane lipoprotein LolB